jgi:hypothetical protein
MTGTKLSPTVLNLPSNDEITRFDGTQALYIPSFGGVKALVFFLLVVGNSLCQSAQPLFLGKDKEQCN